MIPLCPVCDEPMLLVELHEVEVDYCARCHGVWLDEGELELLAGPGQDDALWTTLHTSPPREQGPQQASPQPSAQQASPQREQGMQTPKRRRCPRCSRPVEIIAIGRDPAVPLDRCKQGHGLWFDAGELRQLLRQFGRSAGPSVRLLDELFAPSSAAEEQNEG